MDSVTNGLRLLKGLRLSQKVKDSVLALREHSTLVARCLVSLLARLQPLDYFVWGVLDREVNSKPCDRKKELKGAITVAMRCLNRDMVAKACISFQRRLQLVIKAEYGYLNDF